MSFTPPGDCAEHSRLVYVVRSGAFAASAGEGAGRRGSEGAGYRVQGGLGRVYEAGDHFGQLAMLHACERCACLGVKYEL